MASKKTKPVHRRPTPPPVQREPKPAAPPREAAPPDWRAVADRYAWIAVAALLMIGFLLRVLNLDALSLWVDEFVHVQRAQDFLAGAGPLFADDNNGILLTILMLPFFQLFGPAAIWARLPSVLFGVGMIYLIYRLGARLFNRYVGLLAAFAATFSLYLNFWSRMARNYAIFGFFFLLLALVFLAMLDKQPDRQAPRFWEKYGIAPRYAVLLPLVLVAALLSHHLAFLFLISTGIYAIVQALVKIRRQDADRWNNPYLWLGAVALPVLVILLVPGLNDLLKKPLMAFLQPSLVEWIIPTGERLAGLWERRPFAAFDIYQGVLRYDTTLFYFPAAAGFAAAFALRPRSATWLLSSFLAPFLLMSFVYREPSDPRYFIAVFPYFLIAGAAFFYWAWQYLTEKLWPNSSNSMRWALLALPFVFVLGSVRWAELKKLVLAEQLSGHVVDQNISTWAFTNWKQPCDYILERDRPGDLVMATVPTAASYYLQNNSVLWFRQSHYDTALKKQVPNAPDSTAQHSAVSFENLKRTVENTPRGWLLADYYFDNIFTDEASRNFVYQNMHFYPDASRDGSVMLFGWDNSKGKPQQQNLVAELGKSRDKLVSKDYFIVPPEALLALPELEMVVRASNVNTNREAFLLINNDNAVYLPANKTRGIEPMKLLIRSEWLRRGENKIQICYDDQVKNDPVPGFQFYFMALTGR